LVKSPSSFLFTSSLQREVARRVVAFVYPSSSWRMVRMQEARFLLVIAPGKASWIFRNVRSFFGADMFLGLYFKKEIKGSKAGANCIEWQNKKCKMCARIEYC
jgi:hypothetical protein